METKTLQLWPSGESVTYRVKADSYEIQTRAEAGKWNENACLDYMAEHNLTPPLLLSQDGPDYLPGLRAAVSSHKMWRPATQEERRKIRIEELAEHYLETEVLCCQSALVDDLLKHQADCGRLDGWDDDVIVNLYPNPTDWSWEDCESWLEDHGVDYDKREGGGTDDAPAEDDDDYVSRLRELVCDQADYGRAEIYQWYLVSNWLGRELIAVGEPVIDNDYGMWFGRQGCGQGLIMDGTLQNVARRHVH